MRVVLGQRKTKNFEKNRDQNEGKNREFMVLNQTKNGERIPNPGKKFLLLRYFNFTFDIYKVLCLLLNFRDFYQSVFQRDTRDCAGRGLSLLNVAHY